MRVLKHGSRVSDKQLSLAVLANKLGHARLGLAVAKRFIPKAVDRNAIKRQVREAFRLHTDLPAVDIVVLTRKTTDIQDLPKLRRSIEALLQRLLDGKFTLVQLDEQGKKITD